MPAIALNLFWLSLEFEPLSPIKFYVPRMGCMKYLGQCLIGVADFSEVLCPSCYGCHNIMADRFLFPNPVTYGNISKRKVFGLDSEDDDVTVTSGPAFNDVIAKAIGGQDLATGILGTGKPEIFTPHE